MVAQREIAEAEKDNVIEALQEDLENMQKAAEDDRKQHETQLKEQHQAAIVQLQQKVHMF